jgi:hypothetical protein
MTAIPATTTSAIIAARTDIRETFERVRVLAIVASVTGGEPVAGKGVVSPAAPVIFVATGWVVS